MRLSRDYFFTLRDDVKNEDSASGNLLVRAGMIKKASSGIYMMLPLGYRVLNKIENIVREEMNKIHSLELSMPALIPEEVYIESGRREVFGKSMFSLSDRFNKPFVLGPTHEELFAEAGKMHINSYKDLPLSLYQFQTKYRDEPRPRFGLIRVREFVMKDAY
ncbi:MAG: proline--tRNA ligase, partial [Clostridiaceae bacterium]|nr:proline--tRNA ligase [Clostridiaceae bacterium]